MSESQERPHRQRKYRDDLTALAGSALYFYFMLHPESVEQVREWLRARWQEVRHEISVWQALRAIRDLPQSDER